MSSEDMSELEKLWATEFLLFVGAGVLLWVVIAIVAAVVAPDDRPWSFFWCTLLLGPLGIVLALIGPGEAGMMRRDTMLALCKAVRRKDVEVDRHDVRNVIESHIEALDRIDGGQTVAEREKQLRLVIADLRECLRPDGWDESLNSHWANKARYTVDMIEEMLKGKGLQWNRDWAHDGANEADPETYTGLSGAMSFTHVQKPATWPKAALQVGPEFQCPDAP